jgi:hypothetical protein
VGGISTQVDIHLVRAFILGCLLSIQQDGAHGIAYLRVDGLCTLLYPLSEMALSAMPKALHEG